MASAQIRVSTSWSCSDAVSYSLTDRSQQNAVIAHLNGLLSSLH
jgi:hypothetical protein